MTSELGSTEIQNMPRYNNFCYPIGTPKQVIDLDNLLVEILNRRAEWFEVDLLRNLK